MKKIVLFGGSFDPIHFGHVTMMRQAIKQTQSDQGWFILANQPPLKGTQQLAFDVRLDFIKVMIKPFKKLKVNTIEKSLPVPNYTLTTIEYLKKRHPNYQFSLLIGSDQALQFNRWYGYEKIFDLVDVLVYPRDNTLIEDSRFKMLQGEQFPISSTTIRKGLSQATHPYILRSMMTNGYYFEDMFETMLGDKRANHSKEVAKVMVELAEHYRLDQKRAFGLGIYHDLFKDYEKTNRLDDVLGELKEKLPKYQWHALACVKVMSRYYHVYDKQYLNAIYHHVLGKSNQAYSMMLYISDKAERTRGYDSEPIIALSKIDLNKGFSQAKKSSQSYLKRKEII